MKNCVLECFDKNGEVWVVTSDGSMSLFDKKGDAIYLDSVPKGLPFWDINKLKVTGKYDVEGEKSISLDDIAQFSEIESLTLENITIDGDGETKCLPAGLKNVTMFNTENFDSSWVKDENAKVQEYNHSKKKNEK